CEPNQCIDQRECYRDFNNFDITDQRFHGNSFTSSYNQLDQPLVQSKPDEHPGRFRFIQPIMYRPVSRQLSCPADRCEYQPLPLHLRGLSRDECPDTLRCGSSCETRWSLWTC